MRQDDAEKLIKKVRAGEGETLRPFCVPGVIAAWRSLLLLEQIIASDALAFHEHG